MGGLSEADRTTVHVPALIFFSEKSSLFFSRKVQYSITICQLMESNCKLLLHDYLIVIYIDAIFARRT